MPFMDNITTHTEHNWPIYGHDWAVNQLRKAMMNGRSRHAYLFTGVDGIGKRTLAYTFAMALNAPTENANIDFDHRATKLIMHGSHADIITPEYDEKTGALKIQAVREVTAKLALKPYEARYRIAIIPDFEKANAQAQDALLKTLEEPAESSALFITANTTDNILATITSRCQVLSLRPLSLELVRDVLIHQYQLAPDQADLIARVSGGRMGWAVEAIAPDSTIMTERAAQLDALETAVQQSRKGRFDVAQDIAKLDKIDILPILELWQTYWRDVLLAVTGSELPLTNIDRERTIRALARQTTVSQALAALNATRKTLTTIQTTNTNPRLALEVMFLDYPGL